MVAPDDDGAGARIGIVGTGAAAALHATAALAAGFTVDGVVARRPRGRRFGRRTGTSSVGGAPVVALEDLPGLVDLVVVATDPPSHGPLARRLARLDLPSLVERPLAASAAEAADLAAIGARPAENLRHAPLVVAALARGLAPVDVEVRIERPRPAWGFWRGTEPGLALLVDLVASAAVLALDALGPDAGAARLLAGAELHASSPGEGRVEVDLRSPAGRARLGCAWAPAPLVDLQLAGDGFVTRAELLPQPHLELDGRPAPVPGGDAPPVEALGYVAQLRAAVGAPRPADALAADRGGVGVLRLLTAVARSLRTGGVAVLDDDPGDATLFTERR